MNINLLFSILGPALTDEESGFFRRFGQWVVLNERNGRLLVDGVGDESDIESALDALEAFGRDPRVIGAWAQDGSRILPLDDNHYQDVGPDVLDYSDPQHPVPIRPSGFVDGHRWSGWEAKQ